MEDKEKNKLHTKLLKEIRLKYCRRLKRDDVIFLYKNGNWQAFSFIRTKGRWSGYWCTYASHGNLPICQGIMNTYFEELYFIHNYTIL